MQFLGNFNIKKEEHIKTVLKLCNIQNYEITTAYNVLNELIEDKFALYAKISDYEFELFYYTLDMLSKKYAEILENSGYSLTPQQKCHLYLGITEEDLALLGDNYGQNKNI